MPEQQLKPMRWPRPVPVLWWVGDYADIRERIRRTGRLDRDEIWEGESDDSYNAFCRRHGTYCFGEDWRQLVDRDRRVDARSRERLAAEAKRQQEEWEERRRQRQLAKQAQADELWRLIEEAKAYWRQIKAEYGDALYRNVLITKTGLIDGVKLDAGKKYFLPATLIERLKTS